MITDFEQLDLSGALETLPAPAYVVDCDAHFRWLNRAYVQLAGDLHGRPFIDHVEPDHRQVARTNVVHRVSGHASTTFDVAVIDRAGGRVTLRVTSAPVRLGDRVVGTFGIAMPFAQASAPERSILEELTPRQHEVLRLLTEGLETHAIADRLGIAEETVRNHIRALLRATGAHSRLEAVLMGLRLGLVGPRLEQTDP